MVSNVTYKLAAEKLGGEDSSKFIGGDGDLFYDPDNGILRIGDGVTPGGKIPSLQDFVPIEVDHPVTNQFFIDAHRTDAYVESGSFFKPFKTVLAAQTEINKRVLDGTLTPSATNPVFIVLLGSIFEDITLMKGHVSLIGYNGSIDAPIYITGTVTVEGNNPSIEENFFSISCVAINAPDQHAAILFTGTTPQRLMISDVLLVANGNKTGGIPLTNAGGYGIYSNNTGVDSIIEGNNIKVIHNGQGDVYCLNMNNADLVVDELETINGKSIRVSNTGSISLSNSILSANGVDVVEMIGGSIDIISSIIGNIKENSNGINITDATSIVTLNNVSFQVPNGTGKVITGVNGSKLRYNGLKFIPVEGTPSNNKVSMNVTVEQIPTTFVSV